MSHRLLVVVGGISAVFVLISCILPASANRSPKRNYLKLSFDLAEKGTYDAAGYFKLARAMFETDRKSKRCQAQKDIQHLLRLEKILTQPTCDYEEFNRLRKVALYAGGHEYVANPETLPPVQLIVHTVANLRAHACRNHHLARFNEAYSQLHGYIKTWVEFMKDDLERPEDMDTQEYVNFLVAYDPSEEVNWNRIIQESAHQLSTVSRIDQDESIFDELYDEYLRRHCSEYEATLGPILSQVDFDNRVLGGRVSYTDEELPLFRAIAYARVCEQIDSVKFRTEARAEFASEQADRLRYFVSIPIMSAPEDLS